MYIFEKYLYFSSFEARNRVSNSSFKWRKIQLKQFSRTRVNLSIYFNGEPESNLLTIFDNDNMYEIIQNIIKCRIMAFDY